jgi:hypothetical protein
VGSLRGADFLTSSSCTFASFSGVIDVVILASMNQS